MTQQDLIDYGNPAYFASREDWQAYRRLTRRALATADRVLFFSAHARDDALAEELVEPARAAVVQLGVDHELLSREEGVPPPGAERIDGEREVMLCLGADYRHKNRLFVLRMLSELQRAHGWPGTAVFAGPHVALGSSRDEEDRLLRSDSRLGDAVVDLGPVSDAGREWLLRRADLVVYPTVYEGFGLIPFEAARHSVPCLWARSTALAELLPEVAAGILAWDVAASAQAGLTLLRDSSAQAANLAAVREAGARLSWDRMARELIESYGQTCDAPPSRAGAIAREQGVMGGDLSEDAIRLLGPGGALPRDLERPLLALAARPRLSKPVFQAIRMAYRISSRKSPRI